MMNDQRIIRLEARLEQLVEGMFAYVFGKRIQAYDIALQLARALESGVEPAEGGDTRPIAPNQYTIVVNPDVRAHILYKHPNLAQILSTQITELASSFGYRLMSKPVVYVLADEDLAPGKVYIEASHLSERHETTAVMQPIKIPIRHQHSLNAQIIITGVKSIPLTESVVMIGRSQENHIILEDPYVSRHHAQIRLRFNHYMIFDADSQSGIYVNDVRVWEHRLQAGDVIRIGSTSMVYMDDTPASDHPTGSLDAVE